MAILVQSNKKPSVSLPEQTGSIVTFNSQYAGLPLKSCKVNIPVTQEGTGDPSPDNIRNFVGIDSLVFTATGKNFFGGTFDNLFPLHFSEDTTITVSANAPSAFRIGWYDESQNQIDYWGVNTQRGDRRYRTFVLPTTAYYVRFYYTQVTEMQIELGSSPSDYEPFGNNKLFLFGQTIYGIENGDIIAGSFPIPVYPLNEFSSIRIYNGSTLTNTQTFYLFLEDVQRQADLFILSNIFKQKALSSDEPYCVEISQSSSLKQRIYVSFPVGTTAEQAREYLTNNNVIFLIHLETPEVINLGGMEIATLQGENNLFASVGTTTASFIKIGG